MSTTRDDRSASRHVTVVDQRAAQRLQEDLAERGVPADRVALQVADMTARQALRDSTRGEDRRFWSVAARSLGRGWLVAFGIGAVAGILLFSATVALPWTGSYAALGALGAAVGTGVFFSAVGFMLSAIKGVGERGRGNEPRLSDPEDHSHAGWGASDTSVRTTHEPGEHAVDVVISGLETHEQAVVDEVLEHHRDHLLR